MTSINDQRHWRAYCCCETVSPHSGQFHTNSSSDNKNCLVFTSWNCQLF